MRMYFCPDCGAYEVGNTEICNECSIPIPDDNKIELQDEDIVQIDFIDGLDTQPDVPACEYEVIRLKPNESEASRLLLENILNNMGDKGWELVNLVSHSNQERPLFGVFKRPWFGDVYY